MMLGLELAFILGSLASFALVPLLDVHGIGRRCFYATFPVAVGCAVGGLGGLLGSAVPGVTPAPAALAGVMVGYLALRVADERLAGRPRVFRADEVVVVPAQWRDDLV